MPTSKKAQTSEPAKHAPLIVSSEHLATEPTSTLSELEYAMIMTFNAFSRWMVQCMAAIGYKDFSPLDVLVLHNTNHRKRAKRLADIVFTLNADNHTVNYALKKLMKNELVESSKVGKEMFYQTTEKGREVCEKYRDLRQTCLLDAAISTDINFEEIQRCAVLVRGLSGLYDQASRAASSL